MSLFVELGARPGTGETHTPAAYRDEVLHRMCGVAPECGARVMATVSETPDLGDLIARTPGEGSI